MLTSQFSYPLPDGLIARTPIEPRDSARLLVSRNSNEIIDSHINDLSSYIEKGDLIVVNNTKVLPARIQIVRGSGGIGEIFLLNRISSGIWEALVKPSAKIKENEEVTVLNEDIKLIIGQNNGEGHRIVTFDLSNNKSDLDIIHEVGQTPLPPYLGEVDITLDRYQTMFALEEKSVAAPTAGLHFTKSLKEKLANSGNEILEITLHVGVGTFRPIMTENIEDHNMHSEIYEISETVWQKIEESKAKGNKIIAVGTTSLRTLESVALTNVLKGSTDIYCYGNFDFKIVDLLLTNFHQSESSLLVLLDSFIGSRWKDLYKHAIESKYRFLSFGDAMLVSKGRFNEIKY
ncbi:MAG: tRNA preQ1(34) S-adenosylmethionine ribosyltransferase-isomerase QueA [Acidimicrobiia bacterium]|nr:tRNA preQ1(34) S-adenosylmethionine ribosyltransferase-isomerase QueA [Acidimicrobiia bacterium]